MKESMKSAGYKQGDMAPHVKDYQRSEKSYAERGFSQTDAYIERQDKFVDKEATQIKKQHYMGRYS
jgi:hypothetical protein